MPCEDLNTNKAKILDLSLCWCADDIYRDDIIFRDPRNFFQGKKDYQTIFWSLRFHGQLFFRLLYVDVLRIWESPENVKDSGTVLKWVAVQSLLQAAIMMITVLTAQATPESYPCIYRILSQKCIFHWRQPLPLISFIHSALGLALSGRHGDMLLMLA